MKTLSVVIPIYQNAENIPHLSNALQDLERNGSAYNFEFIFINDGSTDDSLEILKNVIDNKILKDVKIICFTKNFGQIPAIYAGLKESKGELKAIISADLQDDPKLILQMLDQIDQEHPLVIAERANRQDPFFNKIMARIFYCSMRKLVNPNYPIGGYDYCLFTQAVCQELFKFEQRNAHIFVILLWQGHKYKTIQYVRQERKHGQSQWTFRKKALLYLDTIIGLSPFPLRLISFGGGLFFGIGLFLGLIQLWITMAQDKTLSPWTLLTIVILILGGFITISLGILGEYLWRTFDSSRARQNFVIEKMITS